MGAKSLSPFSNSPSSEKINEEKPETDYPLYDNSTYDFYKKFAAAMKKKNSNEQLIISIGIQSLGKSYLLNHIFGTDFETKESYMSGKKTDCLNDEKLEYCRLMDFEGIGGILTSPRRDHANFCFSLTFSNLVLLQVKHMMIYENNSFLEKIAFSYWLTIKKLKYNSHEISKILLILRDTDEGDLSSKEENENKLKSDIEKFCSIINNQINQYNIRLRDILQEYKQRENLNIDIESLIPYEDKYKLAFSKYHAYGWNNETKTIMEWDGNPRTHWRKLDSNMLRVEISQILETIAIKSPIEDYQNVNRNIKSEIMMLNDDLACLLKTVKEDCLNFGGNYSLKEWIIHEYYLSIELDVGFESNTIDELFQRNYVMPEYFMENTRKEIEIIVNEINKGNEICISEHRDKLKAIFESNLIKEKVQRDAIIRILAKDSAYRYSNILGFSLINLIKEISKNNIESYNENNYANEENESLQSKSENLILFIIECIINAPENDKLIFTEINKIQKIKKVFESLFYYNEMIYFYNSSIKNSMKNQIFIAIFSALLIRIKRVFKPEEDMSSRSKIVDTEKKIASFNFDKYRIHLIHLADQLDNSVRSEISEFLIHLKNYFDTRVLIIKEKINRGPLINVLSLCFLYEKHNSIVSDSISIKTSSEREILFGGYAVRSSSCLYENADKIMEALIEDGQSEEINNFQNFKILPSVPIIISTKNLLTGTSLYKSKKDESRLCIDKINRKNDLEKEYKIVDVCAETKIKNCYLEESYTKVTLNTNEYAKTFMVKRIGSDLFSAAIFSFYYVVVTP
ncbi:hypothetical protein SteCoe_13524 [Stentor coeruleus]|uniref:Guanylate-binding protein N-terminal domain-containing protein n=1 Tax=Stentor coeruleus TaxID=5963 RepID=A0A1R2C882_9CILI|nr:hypothetical protein SteCoe_13524 [Stentor coeruleus]